MARWTDEQLLDALHAAGEGAGGPLTVPAYNAHRRPGDPSVTTIARQLGDGLWPTAVARAGLTTSSYRPYRRWTTNTVLEGVAAWWATTDDRSLAAYRAAARLDPTLPSESAVQRFAGGWKGVKGALGEALSIHQPRPTMLRLHGRGDRLGG